MKLSRSMQRVLRHMLHGRSPYTGVKGLSEHGGMARTMYALRRRGLLDHNDELTPAGSSAAKDLDDGKP